MVSSALAALPFGRLFDKFGGNIALLAFSFPRLLPLFSAHPFRIDRDDPLGSG
jgi:hypothetical protein